MDLGQSLIHVPSLVLGAILVTIVSVFVFVFCIKRKNEPQFLSKNSVKKLKRKGNAAKKTENTVQTTKQSRASPAKLSSEKKVDCGVLGKKGFGDERLSGGGYNSNIVSSGKRNVIKRKIVEKKFEKGPTTNKIATANKNSKANINSDKNKDFDENSNTVDSYYGGWPTAQTGNQTDWIDDTVDNTSENSSAWDWDEVDNGKVMVYIDNSNIFINTRKHSARRKKFPNGMWDNNCRIDVGKLVNEARRGRDIIHGKLYGSEPPVLDTVWRAIREEKIQVLTMEKSKHTGKEKLVDSSLCVTATRDLITLKDRAGDNRTIIFFSGDLDMLPVVQTALEYGWKVEIFSYKMTLNKKYLREQKLRGDLISISYIDEIFDRVTFQKYDWTYGLREVPPERSIFCRFQKTRDFDDKAKLIEIVSTATKRFCLPFQGKFVELDDNTSTIDLLLVPSCAEKNGNGDVLYNFDKHIWNKRHDFMEAVSCDMVTYVDYKNQLDQNEYDVIEFSAAEPNDIDKMLADPELYNEDVEDFKLVIPKKSKKHQLYSTLCDYRFCCHQGLKCYYAHTNEEKAYFREHPNIKNRALYKTKECVHKAKGYCKYESEGRARMCPFVHDLLEVRCLSCRKVGLHYTDECPIPRGRDGVV